MRPRTDPTAPADAETALWAHALSLILSWGCPVCGKPFPCAHDAPTESKTPTIDAPLAGSAVIGDSAPGARASDRMPQDLLAWL